MYLFKKHRTSQYLGEVILLHTTTLMSNTYDDDVLVDESLVSLGTGSGTVAAFCRLVYDGRMSKQYYTFLRKNLNINEIPIVSLIIQKLKRDIQQKHERLRRWAGGSS